MLQKWGPKLSPNLSISGRCPPPKHLQNLERFQHIKEIIDDFPSELSSLEFVEGNEFHISKHLTSSWLGFAQGRVFFARGFPGFARQAPFITSVALVFFAEVSRYNRALAVFRGDLKWACGGIFHTKNNWNSDIYEAAILSYSLVTFRYCPRELEKRSVCWYFAFFYYRRFFRKLSNSLRFQWYFDTFVVPSTLHAFDALLLLFLKIIIISEGMLLFLVVADHSCFVVVSRDRRLARGTLTFSENVFVTAFSVFYRRFLTTR